MNMAKKTTEKTTAAASKETSKPAEVQIPQTPPPPSANAPQPTVIVTQAPAKSSTSSCLTKGCIAGCGCLVFVVVLSIIVGFVGYRVARSAAENAVSGAPKSKTGIPEPLLDVVDKFIGTNKDGQEFMKFLRYGLPADGTAGIPTGGIEGSSGIEDYPSEETVTQ